MNALPFLFAAAAAVAAILATIAVWAPRRLPTKVVACATAVAFFPLAWAAMASLLGVPRPAAFELLARGAADATLLASSLRENEAIYVWLQLPGQDEPRAYVLPWNRQLAQQIQSAQREAQANGTGVGMRMPFEPTLDDQEPKVYALPQPALPPKQDQQTEGPLEFAPPGREA